MKATAVPLVIGVLGVIKKGMKSNIEKITVEIYLDELYKITLLDTAHILRRVLTTHLM